MMMMTWVVLFCPLALLRQVCQFISATDYEACD